MQDTEYVYYTCVCGKVLRFKLVKPDYNTIKCPCGRETTIHENNIENKTIGEIK
jgi:hypothetical protein